MSIWIVVIFVILTIVGLVMVGIGLHEKTKHKDNPAGKPGKTYDILLYAGIALAVIGIIGLIWSLISYSKSKKSAQMMMAPQGNPSGYDGGDMSGPSPGYGVPGYDVEMSSVSQGPAPSAPPAPAPAVPQFVTLPDGRLYNLITGGTIPPAVPNMQPMNPFGMFSQPSMCNTNSLNLEEFMKAAKLLKELKDIING